MRKMPSWTAALAALLVAGCGAGNGTAEVETAEARASLERDLTLRTVAAPVLEVATPVELGRAEPPKPKAPRPRSVPKPAPARAKEPPRPEAAPAPEPVAAPAPVSMALAEAPSEPAPMAGGRELAPGQTVTVLPASGGSSSAGPDDVYLPTEPARGMFKPGAGRCPHPPRSGGRPVGIARFPLVVPGR